MVSMMVNTAMFRTMQYRPYKHPRHAQYQIINLSNLGKYCLIHQAMSPGNSAHRLEGFDVRTRRPSISHHALLIQVRWSTAFRNTITVHILHQVLRSANAGTYRGRGRCHP
ncbi:hypothetical protein TNCV_467181 [Trichonephila clavipes]|nr:hypothetical protein TNCV_467181 [Trichonephila clavipes]